MKFKTKTRYERRKEDPRVIIHTYIHTSGKQT